MSELRETDHNELRRGCRAFNDANELHEAFRRANELTICSKSNHWDHDEGGENEATENE